MKQSNSDPMPFMQVDRAMKPKAALLAGAIGVSTQHAIGSLVEWWDLCADPRELETIIEATPDGEEPAVILDEADAALRFRLAAGKDVEPVVLVRLGFLEPVEGGVRVRGMSRYFDTIRERMHRRKAAVAGGNASATARQRKGNQVASRLPSGSTPVERPLNQTPTGAEPAANTEVRGQRSEVRGQKTEALVAPPPRQHLAVVYEKPDKATDLWGADDFFAWAQWKRQEAGLMGEKQRPRDIGTWFSAALMELGGNVEALQEAFYRFGDDKFWQAKTPALPFAGFMSQWDRFIPRGGARAQS